MKLEFLVLPKRQSTMQHDKGYIFDEVIVIVCSLHYFIPIIRK